MPKLTKQKSPLISVITVVRNAEAHIVDCLASVVEQDGADYEHWVVDGNSSDRTVDLLREHAGAKVRWISEPDSGIYDAMNKAVKRAEGDWVIFLGADDRLRQGVLREMTTRLSDRGTLYYGDVWMTGKKVRYAGQFNRYTLALKNICQQALFYPRDVFSNYSFDPDYPIQADWVLNMACWKDPQFRFEHVPLVISDYNDEAGVSSRKRDLAIERDYVKLLNRYFPVSVAWPLSAAVGIWRFLKGKALP